MTEVYLDDTKLDYEDTEGDCTVGDFVAEVEKELKSQRRFIFELRVDDDLREDWRGSALLEEKLINFNELRILSISVESVVLKGIDVLQQSFELMEENIERCVQSVRQSGSLENPLIAAVTGGLTEAIDTLNELRKGAGGYDMALFRQDPANFYEPVLNCMEEMESARQSGDSVLFADVLEYELAPLVGKILSELFPVDRS
ncbi:MAG: hypothetical protein V3V95_02750 [Thermodesulfobacteriota bacterium]